MSTDTYEFDSDSVNERIVSFLGGYEIPVSLAQMKEDIRFLNYVFALNASEKLTLKPEEKTVLREIYDKLREEFGNIRRLEEATGKTWEEILSTINTA